MRERGELAVPAAVIEPLADFYWLFPFTRHVEEPRHPEKYVSLPLAPRPAPRRQIEAAAELLGRIPDWVVALWCCRVHLGWYDQQEAGELGPYIVAVDRAAHEAGAPASVVFFAGSPSLHPGTQRSTRRGVELVKGVLDDPVYGFEPAAEGEPPRLVEYAHTATDPERRLQRHDLVAYLREQERGRREADDYDVYSKETYASILAVRRARRPPFKLEWETTTPGFARPAPPSDAPPVRVEHPKFGVGTVVAREGAGDSEKLTVAFADANRVLLARFVKPFADE